MSKDFLTNVCMALIGGVFIIGIAVSGYFALKLDSQSDRITKLQIIVSGLVTEGSPGSGLR